MSERNDNEVPPPTGRHESFFSPLWRRPWGTAAVIIASAAMAVLLGVGFRQSYWRSEGILIYTPLAVPAELQGFYTPPTGQTLLPLIKSRASIESLCEEFSIRATPTWMDSQFRVVKPINSETVTITLDWADPEQGAAIVNRLMELQIKHSADLRRRRLEECEVSATASLGAARKQLEAARQRHDEYVARTDADAVKTETARAMLEIPTLEMALTAARNSRDQAAEALRRLEVFRGQLGERSTALIELPVDLFPDTRSYTVRQNDLVDAIRQDEGRRAETIKELEGKEQEQRSLQRLYAQRFASKSDMDKIDGEIAVFRVRQASYDKAITERKEEIKRLPARYVADRSDELRQSIKIAEAQLQVTTEQLETQRKRAKEAEGVLRGEAVRAREVAESQTRVTQLHDASAQLRQLREATANEFVIASPARPAAEPVGSNRKTIMLLAFAAPCTLYALLICLIDWRRQRRTAESVARRLQLELLGTNANSSQASADESAICPMAWRLSRRLATAGNIFVFAPLDERPTDLKSMVFPIGKYLQMSGDRVLIVDGFPGVSLLGVEKPEHCQNRKCGTEVVQSLVRGESHLSDLVIADPTMAIDFLPLRKPLGPTELVAFRMLLSLLSERNHPYSRVLILGPALTSSPAIEVLADVADGVIVVLDDSRSDLPPKAVETLGHLREQGDVLMGAMIGSATNHAVLQPQNREEQLYPLRGNV